MKCPLPICKPTEDELFGHSPFLYIKYFIPMKNYVTIFGFLTLCLLLVGCDFSNSNPKATIAINNDDPIAKVNDPILVDGITIGSPKEIQNLSFFILTGAEKDPNITYRTLSKAMENKEIDLKETGSVNQLSINNNSDQYIFIHSGDIVKGGKQDRTISYDVIIPPRAKNVSLASFCVESGRWEQRNEEEVASFSSNTKMLSSRDLKLAARYEKDQGKVWSKVAEQKDKLSHNLTLKTGYDVNVDAEDSATSLQLALENEDLKKVKEELTQELKELINIPNAIGYAYAINGEIHGVEVYNNQQLFADLWDKTLESVVVETISKQDEENKAPVTAKDIAKFMVAVKETDKKEEKKLNKATQFKAQENETGNVVFSTIDTDKKSWVHKSYMKIDTSKTKAPEKTSVAKAMKAFYSFIRKESNCPNFIAFYNSFGIRYQN